MEFNKFYGNTKIKQQLESFVKNSNFPHAIILEGAWGSGKKTLARYIALLMNCPISPAVCFECDNCKKILTLNHPDVIYSGLTDGKALIGIEAVRFIRSDAYIKPNESNFKVYIINDADKMTPEAQNAFLKVLEEPPSYAVFILLCESSEALLTTVKSRATLIKTQRFTTDELESCLKAYYSDILSDIDISSDSFKLALILAHGSVGNAIQNLAADVALKNISLYDNCIKLLSMLKRRLPAFEVMSFIQALDFDRQDFDSFLYMVENFLSDIAKSKLSVNFQAEFFINDNFLSSPGASLSSLFLLEALDITESTRAALTMNSNLQTTITAYAWDICSLRDKY